MVLLFYFRSEIKNNCCQFVLHCVDPNNAGLFEASFSWGKGFPLQKIDENWWKLTNIDREFLHIFWTTWGNSMKFSGKMCLKILLKVTKNQGFSLSSEDTLFEKPQGGGEGRSNWRPHPIHPAVLGLKQTAKTRIPGRCNYEK